jgi:hypothetical protein
MPTSFAEIVSEARADCNGYVCHWLIRWQIKTKTARNATATAGVSGKHVDDHFDQGPVVFIK